MEKEQRLDTEWRSCRMRFRGNESKWCIGCKRKKSCKNRQLTVEKTASKVGLERQNSNRKAEENVDKDNPDGVQEQEADLSILDRLAKPEGPVEVSAEVDNDQCQSVLKPPIESCQVENVDFEAGQWVPVCKTAELKCTVRGLKKGERYVFRVKAVNSEGVSEPLTTDKPILAKNPYDEPDKPGTPEVVDWASDHVHLEWEPPATDGGAPIISYIIEKKPKHDREWSKGAEIQVREDQGTPVKGTIEDLLQAEEYQFRVIAVNKAGPGAASDPSRKVVAKPRYLIPYIDREDMKPITIKVGQNFDFDVSVRGEPPPNTIWTFMDKPIPIDNSKIEVHDEYYRSQLSVEDASRNESGKYTLTATNSSGMDECDVDVLVLDKPTRPEGSIQIEHVYEDQMTLNWKGPADNGGKPVDHYRVEMHTTSGQWVPLGQTDGTRLVVDKNQIHSGHQFSEVNADEGDSEPLINRAPILDKNPYDKAGKPNLVDSDKKADADLQWNPPKKDEECIIEKGPGEPSDTLLTKSHCLREAAHRTGNLLSNHICLAGWFSRCDWSNLTKVAAILSWNLDSLREAFQLQLSQKFAPWDEEIEFDCSLLSNVDFRKPMKSAKISPSIDEMLKEEMCEFGKKVRRLKSKTPAKKAKTTSCPEGKYLCTWCNRFRTAEPSQLYAHATRCTKKPFYIPL